MNVSQFGQKKKKLAVRRLSQGSAGQGHRREDIRRKLEAKRRLAASGQDGSDKKFPKGNVRQGQTEKHSETRPFSSGIKRSLAHSETASKRHTSPLTNTGLSQGSETNSAQIPSNVFSNPAATATSNENKTQAQQGSGFGSHVFKPNPSQGSVWSQLQTNNEGLKRPLQETTSVFSSTGMGSPTKTQASVFGRQQPDANGNIAASKQAPFSGVTAKSHTSPLSGLRNSPSKAGGSILSGLANQANRGNVASIVQTYEQKSSQSSFQTSSSDVFPSNVLSSNQSAGVPRANHGSNVGASFGSSFITSTTAPPNVNIFAMNSNGNTSTVTSSTSVRKLGSNTALFSGYMANRASNPLGSTNLNPLESSNPNPGSSNASSLVATHASPLGSANLNPGSTNPSLPGSTNNFPIATVNAGQTNLASSQQGNPQGIFGSLSSAAFNTTALNNLQNQPSVFGKAGFSTSTSQSSALFITSQSENSPTVNSKPLPNPASVFGGAGLPPKATNVTDKPFSSLNTASQNIAAALSNKGSVFGNAGLPVTSTLPGSTGPFTSSFSGVKSQTASGPGNIFGNTGTVQTSTTLSNPSGPFTSASSVAGISGQTLVKPGSSFGNTESSKMEERKPNSGVFSEKQGPFTSGGKVTPSVFAQAQQPDRGFGNVESAITATGQQKTRGVFSESQVAKQGPFTSKTSNSALVNTSISGSIFGSAGQASTSTSGGVFSGQNNTTPVSQSESRRVRRVSSGEKVKVLKRSQSENLDLSELTSIVIKDLEEQYFDKKLLEREFKIFGANKVSLQPSRQSAVVTFTTHESAKKAKSKALELFPMRDARVFWYRKKGKTSKTPEKPGPKTEFRSRRKSISNALNSIDVSEFQPVMSAQERFAVLDDVDKRIRQAITPYTDIANAPVIVGVCCDMCPEKERYMREYQANLSIFEMVPGTQDNRDGEVPKVEHMKAVKEYSRSAADKLEPLAHELRPVHVLQMTLDYLMKNVMDSIGQKREEWFNFLWNRTRAIRKDITQQHMCNIQSADLVEKITRFHIFCAHYLCEEGMHSFDPKINNENLTKCLQTLKQFYVDLYTDQEVKCPNEAEFQAYDILLNLNEGDTLRKAMQYRLEVRNSPEVKFALEVFSSLNSNNFVRFFKLVNSASYLNACIIHRYFTQVRRSALRVMTKAYTPNAPYPLEVLQDLLAFEDKLEASQFCSHYKIATTEDSVQFSKTSFADPETAFPLRRATNVIESKRNYSIGEVVNGSPLVARPIHEPLSSFDANGRYIGLPNLVQMLQSTPDTPEPESPYEIYESTVSLSSEQQSPVVQEAVEDPMVVFNKEIANTCTDLVDETVDNLIKDISEDALRQVELELQLTKSFADKFTDDSLLTWVREIAKECIKDELEIKRRKLAVADSRKRMSWVVLNEVINNFIKSELVSIAKDAKRVVGQQLKAQSFAKMSVVIMREMLEDVISKQCQEIAFTTHKEIVRQKKAMLEKKAEVLRKRQMKRYFETWSKEYHTRVYIRNILQEIPAKPPLLTTKQQLEKLLSNKDSTGTVPTSLTPYSSLVKERAELQKKLSNMTNEVEMKRLRAMQPINFAKLRPELPASALMFRQRSVSNDCMKAIVSFPSHVEPFSLENIESLIKFKLQTQNTSSCSPGTAELERKLEQLSRIEQLSTETLQFQYDIKACYGVLSTDEVKKVQQHYLLRGLTGIFFILDSNGQIQDKMFWGNCRTRLRQILRSKPPIPRIPLVIMDINIDSTDEQSYTKEQLGIENLRQEDLISDCVVYVQQKPMDSDELHKQLVHALLWLMSHSPETPLIKKDTLKGFVEKEILKHFTTPVHEEALLRKKAFLQPQCPEVIVNLYNAVIDHVIAVVTNVKLKDLSLPNPEFIGADSPPLSWNSTRTFQWLHSILRKMKLPMPSSPAADGTWHSEFILCLDYLNFLLQEGPLKKLGFSLISRIEKIFNPYAKDYSDLSTTTLTAADVPWPQVIDACINTLLSGLHTLFDGENVYYMPQDLDEFKLPILWIEATRETVKLTKGNYEREEMSKLADLSTQVEQELTRIASSRSILNQPERELFAKDDMEDTARRFERFLGKEKRNCRRLEDELRSILEEDDLDDLSVGCVKRQGVKRKKPSSSSGFEPEKINIKKSSAIGLEDLPDLNLTFSHFETSIVSLRDGLEMHRYLEKLTEKKLEEAVDDNFE